MSGHARLRGLQAVRAAHDGRGGVHAAAAGAAGAGGAAAGRGGAAHVRGDGGGHGARLPEVRGVADDGAGPGELPGGRLSGDRLHLPVRMLPGHQGHAPVHAHATAKGSRCGQ